MGKREKIQSLSSKTVFFAVFNPKNHKKRLFFEYVIFSFRMARTRFFTQPFDKKIRG